MPALEPRRLLLKPKHEGLVKVEAVARGRVNFGETGATKIKET